MNSFSHILLSAALLCALTSTAMAQTKKFAFGLKAGANFYKLDDLAFKTPQLTADGMPVMSGGQVVYDFFQQNDSRSTGVVGGVFARFGNRIFIQPEVLLSMKGGKIDIIRQGILTQSVDLRRATIDLPLLLGFRLGPLRINAGPMASLTVLDSGNLKETVSHYTSQAFKMTVRQARYGYQAGVGLTLAGLQLDLRREGSLAGVRSQGAAPTGGDARFSPNSSLWQLTVGYGF